MPGKMLQESIDRYVRETGGDRADVERALAGHQRRRSRSRLIRQLGVNPRRDVQSRAFTPTAYSE